MILQGGCFCYYEFKVFSSPKVLILVRLFAVVVLAPLLSGLVTGLFRLG